MSIIKLSNNQNNHVTSKFGCTGVHNSRIQRLVFIIRKVFDWAQNLRQGIVMKTSFETRVSGIGPGSFVNIHIFVMKYFSYLVSPYSPFLSNLLNQIYKMLKPQKGNAGVSFNDTLLNFGLWDLLQHNVHIYNTNRSMYVMTI